VFTGTAEWMVRYPSGARLLRVRARFRSGRLRLTRCVGCSRGSAWSFALRCAQEELNLFQFAAGSAAEASAGPSQVVRCEFADANLCGELLNHVPHQLFGTPPPEDLPALLTRRKTFPVSTPAAIIHPISWLWTRSGTGTVWTWPAFPLRSTIAQCPSRYCR
jgi:hypothetical protein